MLVHRYTLGIAVEKFKICHSLAVVQMKVREVWLVFEKWKTLFMLIFENAISKQLY